MSSAAIAFGYPRRRRLARHIALADYAPELVEAPPRADVAEPDEHAAESFAQLRVVLSDVIEQTGVAERVQMRYRPLEPIVVCGLHGTQEAARGRCPVCAGYAMPVLEIVAWRERKRVEREGEGA